MMSPDIVPLERAVRSARALSSDWEEPQELRSDLLPVERFDTEMLPDTLRPWVEDIATRMCCAVDYVAVSAIVAAGSVVGRKLGIRPQRRTSWVEVPNMWGLCVGRPGEMKSPAMEEGKRPLERLEAEAHEANEEARQKYAADLEVYKLRKEEAQKRAKKAIGEGRDVGDLLQLGEPEPPKPRRYVTNDTSYEALGEIAAANPNGVCVYRDEVVSLLRTLDREDNAAARGFLLEAWGGKGSYTFDRIGRGQTRVDSLCISLLGSTQPGRLSTYMQRALSGGAADDGLIQRFGLLVWPDPSSSWTEVDRYPDLEAKNLAWDAFKYLDDLTAEGAGAERDEFETIPFVRFGGDGHALFSEWRDDLEHRRISAEMHPALESHLAKFRKLVPSLALIFHLLERVGGPVAERPTLRALAMARYLESHARRAYASGSTMEMATARAILSRIGRGDLGGEFAARDIYRQGWSNLSVRDQVDSGLIALEDHGWIRSETIATAGRSKKVYHPHPRAMR